MEREIIKADPKYKKQLLIRFLILVICLAIGLAFLRSHMENSDPQVLAECLSIVLWLIFIPPILFAVFFIRFALRCQKEGRFPPTGTKVIKDTVVLHGQDAKRRSLMIIVVSAAMILISLGGIFFALTLINML